MSKDLWDSKIANAAAMTDHCMKLGGLIIPTKPKAGFSPPEQPKDPR